jgi:NifU-like protein
MIHYSFLPHEHFLNPTNVGDIINATAIGSTGSLVCGAVVRITLLIDEKQQIVDAKFKAAGCSYLVACASSLTEQVKGKTTGAAAGLAQSSSNLQWESFPAAKEQCARLACEALISAIRQYSDSVRDEWVGEEALICTCFGVSERTIEREIRKSELRTIDEVTRACNAGAGCRSCYSLIEDILDDYRG